MCVTSWDIVPTWMLNGPFSDGSGDFLLELFLAIVTIVWAAKYRVNGTSHKLFRFSAL